MSISITAGCVLMDVEGTTSSIEFVHQAMFPFAAANAGSFLESDWGSERLEACLELLARDCQAESRREWLGGLDGPAARARVLSAVLAMMARDAKLTGLKQLQGMIWKRGFESGLLTAHVYEDVPGALRAWKEQGIDLRVYSSGSIEAQHLFFGHTSAGNLRPLFSEHYDTTTGGKRETPSYLRIAEDAGQKPGRILFLSDIPEELDAAAAAGMQVVLCCRPGNAPVTAGAYAEIGSFAELAVRPCED